MPVSTFKGVIPVEDWSQVTQSINDSFNKFSALNRQREKEEEAQREKGEARYLEQAKIDPIYTVSSYWQNDQGNKINQLQQYIGSVYRKSNYKPNLQDQIDIQNHLSAFHMQQQKIKADMDVYEKAAKEIENDPYGQKHDLGHFLKRVQEWADPKGDGQLAKDLLLPPKIDIGTHLRNKHFTGTKQTKQTEALKGGKVLSTTTEVPMTEEEKRGAFKNEVLTNPSVYRTLTEEYGVLSPEEKKKYNIEYSPTKEAGDEIIDYGWDKYKDSFANPIISEKEKIHFGRKGEGEKLVSDISTTPTDKLILKVGEYKKAGAISGQTIESEVDTYGSGVSLPSGIVSSATSREYFDMETGQKQKAEPGQDILIKNAEIKYVPVEPNGKRMLASKVGGKDIGKSYLNKDGTLKGGYKIKAVLITRPEGETGVGLDFTPELKRKLMVKYPKYAKEINNIPFEITPKGTTTDQNIDTEYQPETYSGNGKTYQFPSKEIRDKMLKKYPKLKKVK